MKIYPHPLEKQTYPLALLVFGRNPSGPYLSTGAK